jgi:hypothetical protein
MAAPGAKGFLALGLMAGIALDIATARAQEEEATRDPAPRAPELPTAPRRAVPVGRSAGITWAFIPLKGPDPLPRLLVAGEGALALSLPRDPRWALEMRIPFLLHPAAWGNPGLGLSWTFLERANGSCSALQATLRIFIPTAPADDLGAFFLARARPFLGPDWERSLTVAPGLAYRLATRHYALLAEASLQTATTGVLAAQVAIAYVLGVEVRLPADFRLAAEVAGRTFAHGGLLDERSLVGLALGVRRPFGVLSPQVGFRWALAEPRGGRQPVIEVGAETRW